MGCDKICQAKKDAAAGQRQADAARNAKPPAGPSTPGAPRPTGTDVKITTVGHILGVHETKNALTPLEVISALGAARRNSKITQNSTAAGLIAPIDAAFKTYIGLKIAQGVFNIAKPVLRMAVQINGIIVLNFAMLPELLGDIALLILTIFVGLAPIFLSLLKNIFMSIPIDIGIMTTYQLDQLKEMIVLSKIEIKNVFLIVIKRINANTAIKENNRKASARADLGGGSPTGLIDFSNVSNVINNYIQNNISPYSLNNALATSGYPAYIIDPNDPNGPGIPNDPNNPSSGPGIPGSIGIPGSPGYITIDDLKNQFIEGFENGMNSCKEVILEMLSENLKKLNINILEIEGMDTFDEENKNKAKQVSEGLHDATKRIEMLQAGEILKRQFSVSGMPPSQEGQVFDDNELAIAAANNMLAELEKMISNLTEKRYIDVDEVFLLTFHNEVEKKIGNTLEIREDIAAIDLAQELILQNKNAFIVSMINNLDTIILDKSNIINIDDEYEQSITNDFTILKEIILTQQTAFINTSDVTNTSDMISLKDAVYANSIQSVIDALIVVDTETQKNFSDNVRETIDRFKRSLYTAIKVSIEGGEIPIDELNVPDGIDKYELKKMLNILLDEVKKKLIKQGMDIIIEEVIPCKSCKPYEDMIVDMNLYVAKTIQNLKNNIIKYLQGYIMNTGEDWIITDATSIENRKNYLIGQLTLALQKPSGELQLEDNILYRIQMEEDELIKNVRTSLQAV